MNFKEYFTKTILNTFFIVTTCVCAVIAVLGMLYDPGAQFGYGQLLAPILFGGLSTIPQFVTYSRRELTFRQALARKVLQLLMVEAIILLFMFVNNSIPNASVLAALALSVLVVYATVELVLYLNANATAKGFNKALKALQQNAASGAS